MPLSIRSQPLRIWSRGIRGNDGMIIFHEAGQLALDRNVVLSSRAHCGSSGAVQNITWSSLATIQTSLIEEEFPV